MGAQRPPLKGRGAMTQPETLSPDIAAVAGKLSPEARAWFMRATVTIDGRGLGNVAHFALPDGTVRYYSAELDALTPLGQAVRAHLLGERKDG